MENPCQCDLCERNTLLKRTINIRESRTLYANRRREIQMLETKVNLVDALKQCFGFEQFKLDQEAIIESVMGGKDTFVIMPTGGGKSLCYQLPALIMEGTAIIISPLIALMKDQVDSIRSYSQNDDVAHFLNSSLNKGQTKHVKECIVKGKTKLLFVAPETLTKEENIEFFSSVNISFVAVDEAHCISEWGHDFRPEYRRIRTMVEGIGNGVQVMALTATATPKVQSDIVKNLNMENPGVFISSFNRSNLFYEVRPKTSKENAIKSIVQVVRSMEGKSGIVYVQSRKATEEIAKVLQVNGILAAPYHAGLDSKTRTRVQDEFLMEDINVIVATIAFGMGIDKPDVRFVIHYDIPKSIENYYQETGRAGRDGLEGRCVAFYSHKDILRLEKFLRDKPVSERELGAQLLEEIIGYAETSSCRRKFLLHYFGETYDDKRCDKKCDNCKDPKERIQVKDELHVVLKAVEQTKESQTIKPLVEFVTGKRTKEMEDFQYDKLSCFGKGKDKDDLFWYSLFRQAILHDFLYKEIEQYGVLKLGERGRKFIKKPHAAEVPLNRNYNTTDAEVITSASGSGGTLDQTLLSMLKALRKSEAKKHGVKPWVIFMDPSLNDMCTYYPISMDDMLNISGVSKGKAERYGIPFLELIGEYVEENDIERSMDMVVKQVADKSRNKVSIIQGIDRKLSFDDIARSIKMSLPELMDEMNHIVESGTKLNINYYLEENLDEDVIEDVFDYFNDSESESIDVAEEELREDDISRDEIMMIRIKYISEVAN